MWYVALPAIVVERAGPIESLRRSSFLTRGHRSKVFGLWVLIFIVESIVGYALRRPLGAGIVGTAGRFLWLVFTAAYQAIVIAVVYYDLRVAKKGIDLDRIAAVFE